MSDARTCRECKLTQLAPADSPVCALCRQASYERWARRFDEARRVHRKRGTR